MGSLTNILNIKKEIFVWWYILIDKFLTRHLMLPKSENLHGKTEMWKYECLLPKNESQWYQAVYSLKGIKTVATVVW